MSNSRSWGAQIDNWQQQARKLLKPEEITGLPARTAITFTPGVPPLMTTLVPYFEEENPRNTQKRQRKARMAIWQQAIAILLLAAVMLMWMMTM